MNHQKNNQANKPESSPYSIFVVEDDEDLLCLMQKNLQRKGYHTDGMGKGFEAIASIIENQPDLIILDYRLPDMTGKEFIETLINRHQLMPFLTVTGHGNESVAVEMMKLGARDYLVKDWNMLELLPVVVNRVIKQLESEKKVHETEMALKRSEEKYRKLVDNSLVGVYKTNLKGDILFANEALAKIFNFQSADDMLDDSVLARYKNKKDREFLIEDLKKKGSVNNFEAEVLTKNQKTKHVLISATLLDKELSGMVMDITEKKQAEDQILSATLELQKEVETRKKSEERILKYKNRLQRLSTYLQTVREAERTRISREIHDELGQNLSLLLMDISWLIDKLPDAKRTIIHKLLSMSAIIEKTIKSVQRISQELRPSILDNIGLVPAIEWQLKQVKKEAKLRFELFVDPPEIKVNPKIAIACFRIFQEALVNIIRHAQANKVVVRLVKLNGKLELYIEDNGVGIKPNQVNDTNSLGLIGIQERAISLNGEAKINGEPNKGTTLIVILPLRKKNNKYLKKDAVKMKRTKPLVETN